MKLLKFASDNIALHSTYEFTIFLQRYKAKAFILTALLLVSSRLLALPGSIDSCISTGSCGYGGPSFGYSINDSLVIGHNLFDFRNGNLEHKILMEYQLGDASRTESVDFDYDTYQTLPKQTNDITGSLWLEVNTTYNLSNSYHAVTLYFDQATPSIKPTGIWQDFWSGSNEQQDLYLTTDGLLNSSGESFVSCCEFEYAPSPFQPFSSSAAVNPGLFDSSLNSPLACVADGCFTGAILNLIGLEFTNSGGVATLNFNSLDDRELLYYTAEGYEGYRNQIYTVSAIPIPATAWLFGSGLVGLTGFAKRRKA